MEKGKLKKQDKYLSIILIPHFSKNMKNIRISSLFTKLLLAIVFVFSVSLISFTVYSVNENVKLKDNVSKLSNLNADQQKLLQQKASTINSMDQYKKKASETAKDFMAKYKQMTDNYITSRSSNVRNSDSVNKSSRSFVKDLKDLKVLLDNFSQTVDSSDKLSSSLTDTDKKLSKYIQAIPTEWPAYGPITSPFNIRKDPFTSRKSFHEGMDIAATYGDSVHAAGSGIVTFSGYNSIYGNEVIIDHGYGLTTIYGHTSKLLVKEGERIKKGDVIARVGNSGRSTGTHLHFGVYLYDNPVNPLKYLDK